LSPDDMIFYEVNKRLALSWSNLLQVWMVDLHQYYIV
jgi:hypothetical protein